MTGGRGVVTSSSFGGGVWVTSSSFGGGLVLSPRRRRLVVGW